MVSEYPFEDHQAPPFKMIFAFCKDVDDWLKRDKDNVVSIHCKAGKGRTGTMICCYLLYSEMFSDPLQAMKYYGMIRTKNKKGVTIPSQIRYVNYFSQVCRMNPISLLLPKYTLRKIRLTNSPNPGVFGKFEPSFTLTSDGKLYQFKVDFFLFQHPETFSFKIVISDKNGYEFHLSDVKVLGDCHLEFVNLPKKEKLFSCWFNTGFVGPRNLVIMDKLMLDKLCKDKQDKKFPKEFQLQLFFTPA